MASLPIETAASNDTCRTLFQDKKAEKKPFPYVPLALGIILLIGGVIVLTGSYRLLPNKIRMIKAARWIAGYGLFGSGSLVLLRVLVKKYKSEPFIQATVYVENTSSGPIQNDLVFGFSSRLKTVDGKPIVTKPDDFYVQLKGTFQSGSLADCMGLNRRGSVSGFYLPSSLFDGLDDESQVHFYYDGVKVKLLCRQSLSPQFGQNTFRSMLDFLREKNLSESIQCLFEEDLQITKCFFTVLKNQTILRKKISPEREPQGVKFYEDDQKNGPYKELGWRQQSEWKVVFTLHKDQNISLSEIDIIETTGLYNLKKVWILIPHKPEKNTFFEDVYEWGMGDTKTTYYKSTFNPEKGDRLPLYQYGQYYEHTPVGSYTSVKLEYNSEGLLELKVFE